MKAFGKRMLMGAIVLSGVMVEEGCLMGDVVEKLEQANAAFEPYRRAVQQTASSLAALDECVEKVLPYFSAMYMSPAQQQEGTEARWQNIAKLYINAFDEFQTRLRQVWRDHGNGGFYFVGGSFIPCINNKCGCFGCDIRGNAVPSPIMTGCWQQGRLVTQKNKWIKTAIGEYHNGFVYAWMPTDQQLAEKKGIEDGSCADFCCDFWCCCCGSAYVEQTQKQAFEYHIGQYVRPVIAECLHNCKDLKACGKYWLKDFCDPVADLLFYLCNNNCMKAEELSLEEVLTVLNLYRAYVESDCGYSEQYVWAQKRFNEITRAVHGWFIRVVNANDQKTDSVLYAYITLMLVNWNESIPAYNDNKEGGYQNNPDFIVPPLGYYQITFDILNPILAAPASIGTFNLSRANEDNRSLKNILRKATNEWLKIQENQQEYNERIRQEQLLRDATSALRAAAYAH